MTNVKATSAPTNIDPSSCQIIMNKVAELYSNSNSIQETDVDLFVKVQNLPANAGNVTAVRFYGVASTLMQSGINIDSPTTDLATATAPAPDGSYELRLQTWQSYLGQQWVSNGGNVIVDTDQGNHYQLSKNFVIDSGAANDAGKQSKWLNIATSTTPLTSDQINALPLTANLGSPSVGQYLNPNACK